MSDRNLTDEVILWLFFMPAGIVMAAVYATVAIMFVPVLVPYYLIRRSRGRDAANEAVKVGVILVALFVLAASVVTWAADPLSLFLDTHHRS